MTREQFEEAVKKAADWAWNDFCYKPMEFYASPLGAERFREYVERGAYAALEAAGVELDESSEESKA